MSKAGKAISEIVQIGKDIYEKNYITGPSGNISVRIDSNTLLVTPSGVHKGRMTERDIIICDINGQVSPDSPEDRVLSSEFKMHEFIYKNRPEIKAIIHAHPAYTLALTLRGFQFNEIYLPETAALGDIGFADYATPSTMEVVDAMEEHVRNGCSNLVMDRHGTVNMSGTLEKAFINLELLEHTSKVISIARSMGDISRIQEQEMVKLREVFK